MKEEPTKDLKENLNIESIKWNNVIVLIIIIIASMIEIPEIHIKTPSKQLYLLMIMSVFFVMFIKHLGSPISIACFIIFCILLNFVEYRILMQKKYYFLIIIGIFLGGMVRLQK